MKIGESLKRFRAGLNLSQKDVAAKLGMLPQSYYRYESGRSVPQADVIVNLANAYNVSADYLLGISDTPRPVPYDEKEVKAAIEFRDTYLKMKHLESVMNTAQVPTQ